MDITTTPNLTQYSDAIAAMEERVDMVRDGKACGLLWLLEHPSIYTAGTSAKDCELLQKKFPIYKTGRGGKWTYHGEGQRILYVIRDLRGRALDLRKYVQNLEDLIIAALKKVNIDTCTREGRIGIWTTDGDKKIASIGVRVRSGIAYHGAAINIAPDLSNFDGIIPCGLENYGVTSAAKELNKDVLPVTFCDKAIAKAWSETFSETLKQT